MYDNVKNASKVKNSATGEYNYHFNLLSTNYKDSIIPKYYSPILKEFELCQDPDYITEWEFYIHEGDLCDCLCIINEVTDKLKIKCSP